MIMIHDHSNPERHTMKASKSDVEHFVASISADPRAKTVLKDGVITATCTICNQPILMIDVEFTDH
jgi:hypothetical protein